MDSEVVFQWNIIYSRARFSGPQSTCVETVVSKKPSPKTRICKKQNDKNDEEIDEPKV